ncbi:MAG TPA: hypothetical protein PLD23_17580, partial [Armatimonadota bacterium]|nr:hypothetical protein [Armatimonadota bacterium]
GPGAATGPPRGGMGLEETGRPGRQSSRALTVALWAIVIVLSCAVVFQVARRPRAVASQGPDDSSPLMGAKAYMEALTGGDWAGLYQTLASPVQKVLARPALESRAAAAAQRGMACAMPQTGCAAIDQGEIEVASGTIAYVAFECPTGTPQTVMLIDEAGHWKVCWSPLLDEVCGVPLPYIPPAAS